MRPSKDSSVSTRLINFPQPLPEESLHSLLITAYRRSGFSRFKVFTETVFGQSLDGRGDPWATLPIARLLADDGDEGLAILQRLHLHPYFLAFAPPGAATRAGNGDPDYKVPRGRLFVRGMLRGVECHRVPLWFCPVCDVWSQRMYGRSAWFRPHQLPKVRACWRHGTKLVMARQDSCEPLLPNEFLGHVIEYERDPDEQWFALESHKLLVSAHQPAPADARMRTYRLQGQRLGLGPVLKMDCAVLADLLIKRFKPNFLIQVVGTTDPVTLKRFLSRTTAASEDRGVLTPWHLLAIEVLFGSQEAFFARLREEVRSPSQITLPKGLRTDLSFHRLVSIEQVLDYCQAQSADSAMQWLRREYPHTHRYLLANPRWANCTRTKFVEVDKFRSVQGWPKRKTPVAPHCDKAIAVEPDTGA